MTAFASSDDAVDGYRHLEEYIFQTERNHDREIRHTIRPWNWQNMQIKTIKGEIGTNKIEVGLRAYSMGLNRIRNETSGAIDNLNHILSMSLQTTGNMYQNCIGAREFQSRIGNLDYSLRVDKNWDLAGPTKFSFRDSEFSEVQDSYSTDLFLGAWVNRAVIGMGLSESGLATDMVVDYGEDLVDDFDRITNKARDDVESIIAQFVTDNHSYWAENGIRRKNYNKWVDIKNEMSTGRKDTIGYLLEDLEDSVK